MAKPVTFVGKSSPTKPGRATDFNFGANVQTYATKGKAKKATIGRKKRATGGGS